MTTNLAKRIRLIYGVVLSISIILAGICLLAACVGIYRTGDHPFSREAVVEAFVPISVPVYLCLGLTVLSFPLSWWLPKEEKKLTTGKQNELILRRLHDRTDLSKCGETLRNAVAAEQKRRRSHTVVRSFLLGLTGIVFTVYILTGDRFLLPDINSSMVKAMWVLLPCLAVTAAYAVYAAYRSADSIKTEIALLKQAPAAAAKKPEPQTAVSGEKRLNRVRGVILAAAIAILIFGFVTGGTADVLTKAINICTECIGLG